MTNRPEPVASAESPAVALRHLIMGFRTTQLIHVAAKLSIADLVKDRPQTPAALAAATNVNARALSRVLRALASLGIFAETGTGEYRLTPLAEPLLSDAGESVRALAILYGDDWFWRAFGSLLQSVKSGEPAFDAIHGAPFFEYLGRHPDAAAIFDQAMTGYSRQEAAAIVGTYDFSRYRTVIDVGGGQGFLLAAVLGANPAARGILFDQPSVAAGARLLIEREGLRDRCAIRSGNFFESVPAGGDLYLLKSILHDWEDDRIAVILRMCRAAMGEDGRLLVMDRVVPPGNGPSEAKLFDINMMVNLGARERTEREFAALFETAGFELVRVILTASPLAILETARRR